MTNLYRIKAFSMMAWWIACSIFVWPVALMALALVLFPLGFVLSYFQPSYLSPNYQYYQFVVMIIVAPIFGMLIAASMSFLQGWVLRTRLYWAADDWRKWTVLGGAVGGYTVLILSYILDNYVSGYSYIGDSAIILAMPVFITIISAFQFFALRHAVKDAWLWILGNAVAGIVFAGLLIGNQPAYTDPDYELMQLGLIVLAPLVLGFITGYVMLFLFEKKLLPMQPATVPVVVERNRPPSIWDDAL